MSVRSRSSIATKLTLLVLLGTGAVLLLILGYSGLYSRDIILVDAKTSAKTLARSEAGQIDSELRSVETLTKNLALALEFGQWPAEDIRALTRQVVEDNREIYGSTIAFEPYALSPDLKTYAPYFYRGPKGLKFVQLGNDSYDYFTKDWYHVPRETKVATWSAPYFDEGGGNALMTTYSCPFFERKGEDKPKRLRGIVTADVALTKLTKRLSEVRVVKTGFAFLISEQGTFLAHPNKRLLMRESMFSLAEAQNAPILREIGRKMIKQDEDFVDLGASFTGKDTFLAFAPLATTGWSLGVLFPKDELFAEAEKLQRTIQILAFAGVVLLLTVSLFVARSITKPLRRMAEATKEVAEGNLEIKLADVRRQDEVGELAGSFMRMAQDLKQHIKDLTETTAAKERIDSELSIAAGIQRSMLPSRFPAFPDRGEFDIYATMRPAREVGGDFYDFFLLDRDRLCVVIGDVSGKGVPAALFMSVTKYLIEAAVAIGETPDRVLERVNNHLARNNESCMFVTIFLGILNLRTGEFLYANAGHNSPLLVASNQQALFLEKPSGPILGVMEDAPYRLERRAMKPGTLLVVYTDGVTEAFSVKDELFSEERLSNTVVPIHEKTPKEITDELMEAIDAFAEGTPQADDITVITLRFKGWPTRGTSAPIGPGIIE